MNQAQAKMIREELERAHPLARLKEMAEIISDGKDEMAERISAREALDEYIKQQRIKEALDVVMHCSKDEIHAVCDKLKKSGRI